MAVQDLDDKVVITHPKNPNTTATILKYGATVISWKENGQEQLWLSEGAKLDGSRPVRGGIPLVFPVFGKQKNENHPTFKLPQHGFARNSHWEFLGQVSEEPVAVQFGLGPENVDKELYKLWDEGKNDFTLILTVSLAEDSLTTSIDVENTGSQPFDFNWLFHTYYKVDDVTDTLATNLMDSKCFDQLLGEHYVEKSPMLSFQEEFDRIYENVDLHKVIQLVDRGNVLLTLERHNLPDAVVWNPWVKKSEGMADFLPKDGYLKMLCVEPGHVASFVTLDKGAKWSAAQKMTPSGEIKVQTNIYEA
ncbi:hypothetical protein ACI3LY_004585 [Candidozyma auris]|uniref:Glucose-6-phosphate 1-epimerase n=2 Tax=Candidozyma auris TaxID=498019 RepID=A0AB36VYH8_CANAR|nr:hypothetical protein QG37_03628 [[Candida] auris]PIS48616.1 hypothetical protein B9J08_005314 [[Candida] auris]PIS49229.1 hypothetical protein CJI97_005398 [[Candida] auris]PSK75726.1 hypothetical protein CJJ07_004472 [[Candida] auris]QEL61882.1 hypothetical protein CJJ09_004042 [[Candida] auris]